MKSIYILCILCFISLNSIAQSYFQQQVNYYISVTLDDSAKTLSAFENLTYINNSPDTLKEIYFHLWPNAYRNAHTPFTKQQLAMMRKDFALSPESEKGYIDSLNFKVNDHIIKWEYVNKSHEIAKLILDRPLLPNGSIEISTPFFVKLPFLVSRMGYDDDGNISITQWYPKPAVYDRYGWHTFPYYDMGEFYSEFGNFNVSITVPENFVVAATGNLQTQSEIDFLNKKIASNGNEPDNTQTSEKMKTIRYTQNNAHDFAWFTNPNYIIEKGSVTLPNGHAIETWLFYLPKNKTYYKNMLGKVNRSMEWLSEWNGNYPYKTVKVVDGGLLAGGGMEYPTITVIASMNDSISLEETIVHEICHNWFYGILGFNEREFPFMDEGITTSNQLRYMQKFYPNTSFGEGFLPPDMAKKLDLTKYPQRFSMLVPYLLSATSYSDCPTNTASTDMIATDYETIIYMKTAYVFYYLRLYLGESLYNKCMNAFYDEYKFKHPYPEDLKKSFEATSGKDLSWFFDQTIATSNKADYKIKTVRKDSIVIKNKGKIDAPFQIGFYKDGNLFSQQWVEGFPKKKSVSLTDSTKDFDYIKLNPNQQLYELPKANNFYRKRGLFKKMEPIKFKAFAGMETPNEHHLYYFPVIAGNFHNGFMLGMAFYNSALFKKQIEFQALPLLSFSNNPFAGMGALTYNWFQPQTTIFRLIQFKVSTQKFALLNEKGKTYERYNGQILFYLDGKHFNSTHQILKIENLCVSNLMDQLYYDKQTFNYYNRIEFTHYSSNAISPYKIDLQILSGNNFSRAELSANYKAIYDTRKHFIGLKLFAGSFLFNKTNNPFLNFRLSGVNGTNDITYDQLYLSRNYFHTYSDFFSQQFTDGQGGFSYYSPFQSNSWLAAMQFRTSFPAPRFLHFYINIATFDNINTVFEMPLVYELGIEAELVPNILKIYFPIAGSNNLLEVNKIYTRNYFEKIRFVLNLNKLNPFTVYDKFLYHFAL